MDIFILYSPGKQTNDNHIARLYWTFFIIFLIADYREMMKTLNIDRIKIGSVEEFQGKHLLHLHAGKMHIFSPIGNWCLYSLKTNKIAKN